ncbi:unnamed protein product [Nippostrongylus brasiliensis]|uniref:Putative carbonic anhydrase-like protein 2 (inferred by orthology to a C. elegans protein) n=1 Tax=Nippostrongylus brasiliensis TaxID=27835 RepID=A0A0N4YJT1_NIPBR|nr:unnamed protein product [Nippostrongylus brasiliensis]
MTACIYPCVVGPDFWGLVNRDWRMCTAGQMQSPVNIDPAQLLFDPHLGRISVDDVHVEATFENIGQLPIITMNETLSKVSINITGGPALPYRYRLHQISMHFGQPDGERGSEHTVDRVRFPAEVQLLAYNIDLYTNYSQAMTQPRGLLAIAVIVDLQIWNELQKTESKQSDPAYMTPAYRPLKALNGRLLRTNINVNYRQTSSPTCSSNLYTEMGYRSNPARARHNQSMVKRDVQKYTKNEVFQLENIERESVVL